jgi:hypothetical protein
LERRRNKMEPLKATEMLVMSFRVIGLDPEPFKRFYGLPTEELARVGVERYTVDTNPGFPDRVGMRDLDLGETALLLNYVHQPADTPYRSSHAIFIHEGAERRFEACDQIPDVVRRRTISLRAFNKTGGMVDADLVDGREIEPLIARLFANADTSYLHAHYAQRGCYACRIERA